MRHYIKNCDGEYFKEYRAGLTENIDEAHEYGEEELMKSLNYFGVPNEIVECRTERARVEEAKKRFDSKEQLFYVKSGNEYFKKPNDGVTKDLSEAHKYTLEEYNSLDSWDIKNSDLIPVEGIEKECKEQLFYAKHPLGYCRSYGEGISTFLSGAHKFTRSEFEAMPDGVKRVSTLVPVLEVEGKEAEPSKYSSSTTVTDNTLGSVWRYSPVDGTFLGGANIDYLIEGDSEDAWENDLSKDLNKIKRSLKKNKRLLKNLINSLE